MNRRNFVVGLGTVATISGVASVTAASFADNVTATSNFQVIVDENLTLRLGAGVPEDDAALDTEVGWTDTSLDFTNEENINFEEDADGGVIAYTNYDAGTEGEDPINSQISLELAVANDPDEVTDTTYGEFLNVDNDGINDQEVGITYVFGDDVNSDNEALGPDDGGTSEGIVDPADVVDLFVFESGQDRISPESASVTEPGSFTATPGDNQIDLTIDLTSELAEQLAGNADVETSLFSNDDGASNNFDLLNEIDVGLLNDGGST